MSDSSASEDEDAIQAVRCGRFAPSARRSRSALARVSGSRRSPSERKTSSKARLNFMSVMDQQSEPPLVVA